MRKEKINILLLKNLLNRKMEEEQKKDDMNDVLNYGIKIYNKNLPFFIKH